MNIHFRNLILVLFSVFLCNLSSYSQNLTKPDTSKPIIFESLNDSIDIASNFYNFYDSLSIYFYPASDKYDNWNTHDIQYHRESTIMNRADSLLKMDTTIIVLQHSGNPEYAHPFCGKITSRFGSNRRYHFHYGIDVDLETGDPVHCAFDGMVRITQYYRGYGNIIVVRHNNGLETVYAHLSRIFVDTNKFVKAGDIIGLGGNTGRSTGSHLHFEVRYLGTAINPEVLIDFDNCKLLRDTLFLNKRNFGYIVELRALKNAKYHYIKSGQTLSHVARMYKTSVSVLCQMNGLSRTSVLQIGQRIKIR